MKKFLSLGMLILLLFSHNVFHNNDTAYAIGNGCNESYEFNNETEVKMERFIAEGINYHHWSVEYKDKYGQDKIKRSESPYNRIENNFYKISVETEFHLKFYDGENQIIAERKVIVEPIKTYINLYETGDKKLSGKTLPNAKLQIRSVKDNGESQTLDFTSDADGIFDFDYDERFVTLQLEKNEEYVTRSQSNYVEKEFIDSNPPIITQVYGSDVDTRILVNSKTLLKGLNLEFYDKNRKLVETNTSINFEPKYSILGDKKNQRNNFFEDGIKYVRYQAFNMNGCQSEWAEMELVNMSAPKFELNPWMEGDDYVTGISDPGTRIEWRQNSKVKGTMIVPNSGKVKIKFPLNIKVSPPEIKFFDEIGNSTGESIKPVTRIDKFFMTEDTKNIFILSDNTAETYYGKNYTIEFNGKLWTSRMKDDRIPLDGADIMFDLPKLPFEIKFTLYNADGSVKYYIRQMIYEREKPSGLKNIRYDLNKQKLYAISNQYYTASIWNKKTKWNKSVYAKTKQIELPLSDNKKIVKVGDTVTLYSYIPYTTPIIQEIVIKQNKKLSIPKVKNLTMKSKYVEGTTYSNSKVLVKSGKKNYQGQSDSKGKFKIKIPSLSAGSEVAVSAVDRLNQSTPAVKLKVLRVFTKFTISKIKSGGTALKGTGYIGSEVKAYKSSKLITKGTVDKKGNYTLKVSKLKKNDTLLLKMSKSGFETMTKTIRVN